MKAFTDKSKIIDTIDDRIGGNRRPILFVSSSSRRQHLPTPPRHEMRGSNGSSYFGCARNDLRSKDRSRRTVQSSQYEPNGSARVGEGRSVVRGRVLSQSLLVARERRRRELGSNLVIDTIALTSGEGHVVEVGISRRVRKILAGVPASVSIRDHILAPSFSRSVRQYWTVGNRPIRNNDLRSLHRNSVEAQIQDRSRQKTGLNTAPGFSRVSNKPPLRGAKGTRAQHAGDARNSPPPSPRTSRQASPVIPADYPVIPADAGTQKKTKHAFPPSLCEGGRERSEQGDARNSPQHPHNRRTPPSHNIRPLSRSAGEGQGEGPARCGSHPRSSTPSPNTKSQKSHETQKSHPQPPPSPPYRNHQHPILPIFPHPGTS